ncbi:MAG: type 1 glutamine amidotransferase [Candidatus Latescibacterota bacterium]|nr:type 1 glutamine amidotransferase [Candidatus Latescibacterota bacterium]
MARVLVLQHAECEAPGLLEQVLVDSGIFVETVHSWCGEPIPKRMNDSDGLVVMGGPMGVYDQARHPFLVDEMRLIDRAVKNGAPVLGICLGSQLLATVLGAQVRRGMTKELGWHEVELEELAADDELFASIHGDTGGRFSAFHWHGDIFDVPPDALSLARSSLTPCQAFVHGSSTYGILFHMEMTQCIVEDVVEVFGDEARQESLDPAEIVRATGGQLPALHRLARPAFEAWAAIALGAAS